MPPCPIAIPSSTAIVLNSRGTAPAARTASAMTWPTSRRCTCPGTNSVKLLATATIGLSRSSRATPVARSSARAPAMLRPCVTVRDLSGGMVILQALEASSVPVPRYPPGGGGSGSAQRGCHVRDHEIGGPCGHLSHDHERFIFQGKDGIRYILDAWED